MGVDMDVPVAYQSSPPGYELRTATPGAARLISMPAPLKVVSASRSSTAATPTVKGEVAAGSVDLRSRSYRRPP